jgi:hypothetical protein
MNKFILVFLIACLIIFIASQITLNDKYEIELTNKAYKHIFHSMKNDSIVGLNLNIEYTVGCCGEILIYTEQDNFFIKNVWKKNTYTPTINYTYAGDYYGTPIIFEYIPNKKCNNMGNIKFNIEYNNIKNGWYFSIPSIFF